MGQRKSKRKKLYKQKSEEKLRKKKEETTKGLDFPFLKDDATIFQIRASKVMFLMRGLPGSGKSTIVQQLRAKYSRAVVCSADDYFLGEDGKYHFDAEKLPEAHGQCQARAKQSCQNGRHVVIIDNTNIRRWEMGHYVGLAKKHGYVVIVVHPKTPWRFDPEMLATRNKHGVPVDVLKRKLQMFDKDSPIYWGWFFNEEESRKLKSMGEKYFHSCLHSVTELAKSLAQPGGKESGLKIPF